MKDATAKWNLGIAGKQKACPLFSRLVMAYKYILTRLTEVFDPNSCINSNSTLQAFLSPIQHTSKASPYVDMTASEDGKASVAGKDDVDRPAVAIDAAMHRTGVAALEVIKRLEPIQTTSKRMIQMYIICAFMFLGSTMGGFDGSLMGNMLALSSFQKQFGASIVGVQTAFISSMYQIGSVCALPFIGPLTDTWGRRVGIAVGCLLITMGTIIQGTSTALPQYLAGRFFLGFGGCIANVACPSYVVEFAHPVYRGVITGLYNCCYYLGAILAAATLRGSVHYNDNRAWLIPTWVQLVFPVVLLPTCYLFPESPRWFFVHGKPDKCREVLVRYHGNGNPDSLYVQLQMREFGEELQMDGADKRWWDYRVLFNSRAAIYRAILCAVAVSAFSQWTGQSGVSYFLPAMLSTTGITDSTTVLNINLGITLTSGAAACFGASLMDWFGRRKMLITCCATLALLWAGMLGGTGAYYEHDSTAAAKLSIVFVFLIGIVFSAAYTPLQALYPVECLSYEQRAKGMALQNMAGNAAALVNQFAFPIALGDITWKTYFIYLATCTVEAVYFYFIMVETKGHTLEELNEIFKAPNPRLASLAKLEKVEEAVAQTQALKSA
ncbi:related to lactose permease [Cephalotrichum gorgonifer]|uniref:Related to lactose permease n=1 Tax=Cephalotrichum gorgonifer TaxID=2041049 RepID=A0AAE8SSZ8_9PEZI|nr:related to lactose permease [Cephalotrichum gorgonifer]